MMFSQYKNLSGHELDLRKMNKNRTQISGYVDNFPLTSKSTIVFPILNSKGMLKTTNSM